MIELIRGRPMAETEDVLSPETVHQKFKEHGVTHVIWLPDSETNFLFTLLNGDPDLHMVGVGREGNAAAVAAGLYTDETRDIIISVSVSVVSSLSLITSTYLGKYLTSTHREG